MKDIILLIKQRREFYLTVLVVTLVLTIIGAFYNLSVVYKAMNEELAYVDRMTVEQVQILADTNPDWFVYGANMQGIMNGFFNNYTYMGYVGLNLVIMAVMLLSHSDRNEKGAREFLETLPVKRVALELYNYVALMGILLVNILVALGIHLISLGNYNGKIVSLAEGFSDIVGQMVPDGLVASNAVSILYQFGMMALFLVTMITLWFVCMTIFKNGVAGWFVGAILWNTIPNLLYDVRSRWIWLNGGNTLEKTPDSFRKVVAVFDPQRYFEHFEWSNGLCVNTFTAYVAMALVIMLIVMIGILFAHAYCRELSKGKIFYLNCLNVVLLVVGGFWIFMVALDWHGYAPISLPFATVVTVIAEIVAIVFLYHKKVKTYKIAVKEKRKVFNPVMAQGLRSFLIATGIITLVSEYVDMEWNLLWLKHDIANLDMYGWFPEKPWHLVYFDVSFRYQFAMVILAGFIVFKCIRFAMERSKESREFYETLPLGRARLFCTKLLMDLGVILIPLVCYVAVSVGYLVSFNHRMRMFYPELDVNAMVSEQFIVPFYILCVAIALLGVMYLIDAVTVSGGMKNVFCGVTALFILVIAMHVLNGDEIPVLYDLVALIFGYPIVASALMCLVIGIGLLVLAGYLYIRRDKAKEIFYYKAAKYVFAGMLSAAYLMFVMTGAYLEQVLYQYLLAVLGTVLIFFMAVWYGTPGRMAKLQKKFSKKKVQAKE